MSNIRPTTKFFDEQHTYVDNKRYSVFAKFWFFLVIVRIQIPDSSTNIPDSVYIWDRRIGK